MTNRKRISVKITAQNRTQLFSIQEINEYLDELDHNANDDKTFVVYLVVSNHI